jgi:cysteine sulfinate desulfinase/cysteine desulfurase-like protein
LFCLAHHKDFSVVDSVRNETIKLKTAYLVVAETDLAELLKIAKDHNYVLGDDIGILSYNETPLKDILDITVISTDFETMGRMTAALILDKRIDIEPLFHGGGQEKNLRSGTENVAAIVGFGAACELAAARQKSYASHTKMLREQFESGLLNINSAVNVTMFGNKVARLANTSFFAIDNIEGETLVMALDRKSYAVASGSACSSDSTEPSHVLLAMGIDPDTARGAVRVSFGLDNTTEQVTRFLVTLKDEVLRLKQLTAIAA